MTLYFWLSSSVQLYFQPSRLLQQLQCKSATLWAPATRRGHPSDGFVARAQGLGYSAGHLSATL